MINNNSDQKTSRKKYSPQFKDQALERIARDGVPQVAKDLGLAESLLYSWKAQQKRGGDTLENQKSQQAELARLKRDNARLAEENAFLKKAAADSRRNQSEVRNDQGRIGSVFTKINVSYIISVGERIL